jgi:hypothetical protein
MPHTSEVLEAIWLVHQAGQSKIRNLDSRIVGPGHQQDVFWLDAQMCDSESMYVPKGLK